MEAMQQLLKTTTGQPEREVINFKSFKEINDYLKAQFPEIQPNANEFYRGFLHAYNVAAERQHNEEKEKRKAARIEEAKRMWTYNEMREVAIQAGRNIAEQQQWSKPFIIDKDNEHVFHLLCLYFTNNPEFEKYDYNGVKYSLSKGIWLQSNVRGSGKTMLLRCFAFNKRSCYGYIHTTELGNLFVREKFEGIDPFMGTTPQHPTLLNFFQTEAGFMYDEMFSEGEFNGWGTKLYPSKYIINSLYDFSRNMKGQMWKFHITSNYDGTDIEKMAGENFRSRMPDMFNLIKLDGPNRRI